MEIKSLDNDNGYILDDVPVHIFDQLKLHIQDVNLPQANKDLAGNISKEFHLPKGPEILESYILELKDIYTQRFKIMDHYTILTDSLPFCLNSTWVNFQKKYEFNPVHVHSGLFSFVIWVQIPYTKEEELNSEHCKASNTKAAGAFSFVYPDIQGNIQSDIICADKNYEGRIAFFPARMAHCVYPFYTSDQERITVSGNVFLEVNNEYKNTTT